MTRLDLIVAQAMETMLLLAVGPLIGGLVVLAIAALILSLRR